MQDFIQNKTYFVDELNSSKANKFTALYHYSGTGFKKAILNLGIFRKDTKKLAGVLQWGCSFQEYINLNRYVKDNIKKEEYLELNRFCMADSEGKNAESQGISLGVKWIKKYRPDIKLLVSYSGRKEGNYGYIYQATNWLYLGYFLSNGFWFLDGEERHSMTVWYRHQKHGNPNIPIAEDMCNMYEDVRQTTSKQFIYVQLLDPKLQLTSPVLPYPKPATDFPIVTETKIYKRNDEKFNSYEVPRTFVEYYYEKDKYLFSKKVLIKRGLLEKKEKCHFGQYDRYGVLEKTSETLLGFTEGTGYTVQGISRSIKNNNFYRDKIFYSFPYEQEIPEEIEVPWFCIIDEIPFYSVADTQRYLGISRQAVSQAHLRGSKQICGKPVIWFDC